MLKLSVQNLDNNNLIVIDINRYNDLIQLKNIIATKTGISQNNQILTLNDEKNILEDDNKNLFKYNISDNDWIYLKSKFIQNNNFNNNANNNFNFMNNFQNNYSNNLYLNEAKKIKENVLKNEDLLNRILNEDPLFSEAILNDDINVLVKFLQDKDKKEKNKMMDLHTNYMDPKNQEEIEKIIKNNRLENQWKDIQNLQPELLIGTEMLYIKGKINDVEWTIFLDTGAQISVMPKKIADKCNLMKDIDDRFQGIVKGVGQQTSLGRIHAAKLEINNNFFDFPLTILDNMGHDIILGLNFFKLHKCIINWKLNVIEFSNINLKVSFMKDNEIQKNKDLFEEPDIELVKKESLIQELKSKLGLTVEKAKELLEKNGWDLNKAYGFHLDNL